MASRLISKISFESRIKRIKWKQKQSVTDWCFTLIQTVSTQPCVRFQLKVFVHSIPRYFYIEKLILSVCFWITSREKIFHISSVPINCKRIYTKKWVEFNFRKLQTNSRTIAPLWKLRFSNKIYYFMKIMDSYCWIFQKIHGESQFYNNFSWSFSVDYSSPKNLRFLKSNLMQFEHIDFLALRNDWAVKSWSNRW